MHIALDAERRGHACQCSDPDNPQPILHDNTNLGLDVIELDIYEECAPRVFSSSVLLSLQKPRTARILLCSTAQQARNVCEELKDGPIIEYIDAILREGDARTQKAQAVDGRPVIHYDPASLFSWLTIRDGEHVDFQIPECVLRDGSLDWMVNTHIRLLKAPQDRFVMLWFDFRHQDGLGSVIPNSELHKAFKQHMTCGQTFSGKKSSCDRDFLAYLLLDVIHVDLHLFRDICFSLIPNPMIQDLRPRYTGSYSRAVLSPLKRRLRGYYIGKAVIRKAEDLRAFIDSMAEDSDIRSAVLALSEPRSTEKLREFESLSRHLEKRMARWDSSPEEVFRLHSDVFQVRQASSLSSLTVLASIFLPLSLAAGILSMQYRLNELSLRIYDFFGVTLVLCTLAVVAYTASQRVSNLLLKEWYVRSGLWENQDDTSEVRVNGWMKWMMSIGWCLAVISFLIGMIRDYRIGLEILAVALFVALALPIAIFSTQAILSSIKFLKKHSEEKMRRRDVVRPFRPSDGSKV